MSCSCSSTGKEDVTGELRSMQVMGGNNTRDIKSRMRLCTATQSMTFCRLLALSNFFTMHSGTRLRDPPVALHLLRYTCRKPCLFFFESFSDVAPVSRYTPKKLSVAPHALSSPEVSHIELPLKWCRATRGCCNYNCGWRATLRHYVTM